MILFPAVDVLDNRAVRLLYGKREDVTVYGAPVEMALKWQDMGAEYLHIVDLNGAFDDSLVNKDTLIGLIKNVSIP
ncbi:MAG: 1-(5-phosphoribosyl)-5-((5-phosphoribosylamino)methylideneamino)imidazole-4-carboxamide isomerase, partial [Clostridia bacterium]|nr:1-(5-phosphoribosyl)-5-((5-phosphoribosylamino)methylideneamino)imidazole-4-carboxamide isomerase [Clostridia bacterium]